MFRTTVMLFSNDEQKAKWLPMINNFDICGCYAQTELGHGSNVAGLETTAVFDEKTDEFVINTPTITSTKWWPGELGRFANHAAVFARVIIGESDYGVMPFIVQIRSLKDHKHMPGIKTGDLGPKFGYHSKDNGWMEMKNVRVPRANLLQRYIKVERNGDFSIEGDLRVIYAVMLTTRTQMISATSHVHVLASTIGVRYSCVRRQFKNISGQNEEVQLIDYQTQQMKLFPMISNIFALRFASDHMNANYKKLVDEVQRGEFSRLDYCHHLSSGMKAVFTQAAMDNLILLRQSLGGAGFSAWSGIPRMIEDYSPNVTFEGDNTVMLQQTCNLLMKYSKKLEQQASLPLPPDFEYMRHTEIFTTKRCGATSAADFLDLDLLEEALKVNLCHKLNQIMLAKKQTKNSKKDFTNLHNALDMVDLG